MRYLHARLDQPEWMRHPMQEFLATSELMERAELRAWNLSREDVQFALFYVDGDIDAYRARIDDVDPIQWYELTAVDETEFYSYVCQEYTESDVAFFEAFAELSLVVIPPIVYDDGGQAHVTVVGPGEALTELVEALRDCAGVGVDVLEVGTYDRRYGSVTGGLTDRQFEAIETATELGYYAAPRAVSLSAVADELGVADATVSELLRRAESRLMPRLVNTAVSLSENSL
jgi:predicted DNA binding protein